MLSQNVPQIRPFETNTVHVVVRDLDQLLQTEQPGVLRHTGRLNLYPRDIAERPHEVDNGSLAQYINTNPVNVMRL